MHEDNNVQNAITVREEFMNVEMKKFNHILKSFKIDAECVNFSEVDNYAFYDLVLGIKGKVKDIQKYLEEISLQLKVPVKPSIKLLREKGIVRLEFVRNERKIINLINFLEQDDQVAGDLPIKIGKGVEGNVVQFDLAKSPHLIVAGTTGSGKSVILHNIICNLLNTSNVKILLLDPKHIEFSHYEDGFSNIAVAYTYEQCSHMLERAIDIMEARYNMIKNGINVKKLPYLVIVIDEMADLKNQDEDGSFYKNLCVLAQKCRAARIHIVAATQRPSTDVITGTIKANFPARIACRTASHVDSRVILDSNGAENLNGSGDAFLRDNNHNMLRFQAAYITPEEISSNFKK